MRVIPRILREIAYLTIPNGLLALCLLLPAAAGYAQAPASKLVGTVKSISGSSVVLTADSGADTTVTFPDSARIVRTAPGQADLKNATPIQISDIQIGDRLAVRGQLGDAGTLNVTVAVVMKQGDIAQRQQAESDQWRRGVGGIVKDVNPSAGTVTITNSLAAGGKPILVHAGPGIEIKRYSPDSVK